MINVGIIGVGFMGENHLRNLLEIDGVKVVGFMEELRTRAEEISAGYLIPLFDPDSLYDRNEFFTLCDAVIICTPTDTHELIALEALQNQCHVLIEKPICETSEEAEEVKKLANKNNLVVHVGHTERFNPPFVDLYLDITNKGNPDILSAIRMSPFSKRGADVDVCLDLTIHDINLAVSIFGKGFDKVNVDFARKAGVNSQGYDELAGSVTFRNGGVFNFYTSRVSRFKQRELTSISKRGLVKIDLLNRTLNSVGSHSTIYEDANPLKKELEAFFLRIKKQDFSSKVGIRNESLREAIASIKIAEAILAEANG